MAHVCRTCQKKPRLVCSACKEEKEEQELDMASRRRHKHGGKAVKVVCQVCTDSGITSRDQDRYHCAACSKDWGRAKFNSRDIDHLKEGRQKPLTCKACKEEQKKQV